MIAFSSQGRDHVLAPGDRFARPRESGFRDTAVADLQSLVAEIEGGRPWADAVAARYQAAKPWLHRIVTDAFRTAFFDSVLPAGDGPVLDIGSGWGQVARPLARRRPVAALEPVAERLAFIQAAARQDGLAGRICFLEADYFDLAFSTRFEAICAIGVLEWAGAFQEHTDPQERQRAFLRKARGDLAPGGSLVLGIENRLGLKYLLGCPDDHIGAPHIASLPAPVAVRRWNETTGHRLQSFTYSLDELTALLHTAGFPRVESFAAFPDYKLPVRIIPLGEDGAAVNQWLADNPPPPEHNGYDGSALDANFAADLRAQYRRLAQAGQAHHFVPSFFIRAG